MPDVLGSRMTPIGKLGMALGEGFTAYQLVGGITAHQG